VSRGERAGSGDVGGWDGRRKSGVLGGIEGV
jgi:hypothetical protein